MSVLSFELRQWLRPGLLGVVATVDAAGGPQISRHWAVRPLADTDALEFYLPRAAAQRCLAVFTVGARAALNLIELPSYRSRTFKGDCVVSGAAVDAAFLEASLAAASQAMHGVGLPSDAATRMAPSIEPEHFVALRLLVDGVFDQSPKPGAGGPL